MGTAEWKDGTGTWHVVRNTEVFFGGRHKRVRQDGDEVPCAEKAAISARMD